MDAGGNLGVAPSTASGSEKGSLKERMVRAREQLDDLVEQTAEQFRKITVMDVFFVLC